MKQTNHPCVTAANIHKKNGFWARVAKKSEKNRPFWTWPDVKGGVRIASLAGPRGIAQIQGQNVGPSGVAILAGQIVTNSTAGRSSSRQSVRDGQEWIDCLVVTGIAFADLELNSSGVPSFTWHIAL